MNIIEFKEIRKTFLEGKIIANDQITFNIKKGDIHAIIGENGAGKTTLMSILFGLYKPDKGIVLYKGKPIKFKSAKDAVNHGMGMVYQHFQLIDNFSVVDNITLGIEDGRFGIISRREAIKKIESISARYNFNINPLKKIKDLSVGEKQRVEIIKLLFKDVDILILDEPTAMLSPFEIKEFLKILKKLNKSGKTIIFITHKLDEVKEVANNATILRRGKYIETLDVKNSSIRKMSTEMVGKKVDEIKKYNSNFKNPKIIFDMQNISTKKIMGKSLKDINLQIYQGEIISIAGVEGNGQETLVNTITGLNFKQIVSGKIFLNNKDITDKNISKRYALGLAHIPEDRQEYGMFMDLKIHETISMREYQKKKYRKIGILNFKKLKLFSKNIIDKFDVRGSNGGLSISRSLSGGNQQKAVIGREIMSDFSLLVVFQPTRGLDVGAIQFIHQEILYAKAQGKAILLVTYDLKEAISLSDKVVVMNKGEIKAVLEESEINKEKIGLLMTN